MGKICVRSFSPELRKKNEETRTITFVASDGSRDSSHTVLNVDGWDLSRFEKNPVIGYNHDIYGGWYGGDVDHVIGKGRAYIEDKQLLVDITFEPKEINELAEKVFQKILFGSISAVSVGFIPIGKGAWGMGDEAPGEANETYYYAGQQLLEISVVNIPSNANATKKGDDPQEVELEELRAQAVETPKVEDSETKDADDVELFNRLKLKKAAAKAALSI